MIQDIIEKREREREREIRAQIENYITANDFYLYVRKYKQHFGNFKLVDTLQLN